MITFSQDGEDVVLQSFMQKPKGYKGFYIDVGAHHPFRFSNTALFYYKGWRGINIDPNSMKWFNLFRQRDINLCCGIDTQVGEKALYCFDEPALNTFNKEIALDRHKNTKYNFKECRIVKMTTLIKVLRSYMIDKIDFLTIDVEGMDLEVLKSHNWNIRPDYILVEDVFHNGVSLIDSFLTKLNYSLLTKLKRTSIYKSNLL